MIFKWPESRSPPNPKEVELKRNLQTKRYQRPPLSSRKKRFSKQSERKVDDPQIEPERLEPDSPKPNSSERSLESLIVESLKELTISLMEDSVETVTEALFGKNLSKRLMNLLKDSL